MSGVGIEHEVQNCTLISGSYPTPKGLPVTAASLINSIYQFLKAESLNMEIKRAKYKEDEGFKKIIYISSNLAIRYKDIKYQVHSKILFPPNFPQVPPIISIYNIDEEKYEVNRRYKPYILPDGTYEVKLLAARNWTKRFDFKELFDEFYVALGTDFPFFKNPVIGRKAMVPVIYDPRYNIPGVDFPFGMDEDTRYVSVRTNRNRATTTERVRTPTTVHKPYNKSQDRRGRAQTEALPVANVQKALSKLKQQVSIDLCTYEGNWVYAVSVKRTLEAKEKLARKMESRLQNNIATMEEDIAKLQNAIKNSSEVELNEKTLEDIMVIRSEDRRILNGRSIVNGCKDAEQIIEEMFFEKDVGNFEDVKRSLLQLWRKEFDARLGVKAIMES